MKKISLKVFILLLVLGFIAEYVNKPIINESITLNNNEVFSTNASMAEIDNPYYWTENLKIPKSELIKDSPIILRGIETSDYTFENFKEYCFSNFIDLSFPIYYERLGLNQDYSRNLSYNHSSENFLKYTKKIFSTKESRNECFNYSINTYKKIEKYFPITWKKYLIKVTDNCLTFLKNYSAKRNYYIQLEKQQSYDFAYKVGQYESFIYRRLEHDKVPIVEATSYLNLLKTTLVQSVKQDSYSNYKNIEINSEIIISDEQTNGVGAKVKIWKRNSKSILYFEKFASIKCLKESEKNYYLISYNDGEKTLVDSELHILNHIKKESNGYSGLNWTANSGTN